MGFKAFMPDSDPSYPHVDDAEFLEGMREVEAGFGGLVLVHAENDSLLQAGPRAAARRGAPRPARPPRVAPGRSSRRRPCTARSSSPAHAGVRHPDRARLEPRQRRARARPRSARAGRATMEICPHHLLLDLDDLVRLGPYGVCAPALRDRALVERLWDSRRSTAPPTASSPTTPPTRATEKDAGLRRHLPRPLGCQVIQETVPLVLDEAFHRRGMPLDAFVRFSSTNAARISGTYPRKGTLLPGADADLVALRPRRASGRSTPRASSSPRTRGRRSTAVARGPACVRTLVRGETVYADGEILAEPGWGRFLSCHGDYALAAGRRGR